MYTVWFSDLNKVVQALQAKVPTCVTFCSLQGNANGDFLIKTDTATYIVRHSDFSVWRLEKDCRWGHWVEVE